MTSLDIQIKHHKILLQLRRQDSLIQSYAFIEAFDLSSQEQKHDLQRLLHRVRPLGVKRWIRDLLYDDYQEYTLRELRFIASKNHIKNYSRISKAELIDILIEKGIKNGNGRENVNKQSIEHHAAHINSSQNS